MSMERELKEEAQLENLDINEMEERRIDMLNEAGIEEGAVLERGSKHLNTWNSYFNENIVRGKDDMNFTLRDQWTAVERSEFARLFKPAMTFNKVYDPVKKIVGEQRKNKPDLMVRSLTGKATEEQIDEIKRRYIPRVVSMKKLGEEFGVSWHAIYFHVSEK